MQNLFDFTETVSDGREELGKLFKLTKHEVHPRSKRYMTYEYQYKDIKVIHEYRPFSSTGYVYKGDVMIISFNPMTFPHSELVKCLKKLIEQK